MKKVGLLNFLELKNVVNIIDKESQKEIIGAGAGTIDDPFTMDEFDYMLNYGTWSGGYVAGMGFVLPELECTYNKTIYKHYDEIHWRYDLVEGVGIRATYGEDVYTRIENGYLTIAANITNPTMQYNMLAQVVVRVDGEEREVFNMEVFDSYYGTYGKTPLGSITVDLTKYHGHVQVIVKTSGSQGDSYSGYSSINGEQIIYDNYR